MAVGKVEIVSSVDGLLVRTHTIPRRLFFSDCLMAGLGGTSDLCTEKSLALPFLCWVWTIYLDLEQQCVCMVYIHMYLMYMRVCVCVCVQEVPCSCTIAKGGS